MKYFCEVWLAEIVEMVFNLWDASILIIFGYLLYKLLTWNHDYWKNRRIPYEQPKIIFGNFYNGIMLKENFGEVVKKIYFKTNSPLYGFFIFNKPYLLVRDLELIKHILIQDFQYFDNRTVHVSEEADPVASRMMLLMKNPKWRNVRTQMTPGFSSGKLKSMLEVMNTVGKETVEYISRQTSGAPLDSREIASRYSSNLILACAFGVKTDILENDDSLLRKYARGLTQFSFVRGMRLMTYFFLPSLANFLKLPFLKEKESKFLGNIFRETMKSRPKPTSDSKCKDFVDVMLQMRLEDQSELNFIAQALIFFIAAMETTAGTVSWGLYELYLQPDLQNKLRNSIEASLDSQDGLTYEALQNMDYLEMVVLETLRRYPGLPFLDRECTKDYKIPGTNTIIEKGTPIYISTAGLQHDPKHFPEPEKFDPERFSEENKHSIPKYAFMPTGEGPRNCIGGRMGMMMVKVALVHILTNFEIIRCSETPVPVKCQPGPFALRPISGIPVIFKPIANCFKD